MPLPAASVDSRARGTYVQWYSYRCQLHTTRNCNSQMGGASRNFAAITKFLPQKLIFVANLSISQKFCAAKNLELYGILGDKQCRGALMFYGRYLVGDTYSTDQRKGKRAPRPVCGMHADYVLIVRKLCVNDLQKC